ncbi:MAG: hypothetical protein H7832_14965 [Magnetococcus sp. DMHC-6]
MSISPQRPFMITATLFLVLTGCVSLFWRDHLLQIPLAPITVATVHLFVLGVLTMLLIGYAYHFLPLWTHRPIPWPRAIPWVNFSLTVGVLTLFLGVGTQLHRWFLLVASAGVGFGLGFFLLQAGFALIRCRSHHPLLPLIRLAMLALTGVFLLGATFLGEYAHGFLPYDRLAMLGTHLTWGLFGWAGLFILAIRWHLLTNQGEVIWATGGAFLTLVGVPVALFFYPDTPYGLWLALAPGIGAFIWMNKGEPFFSGRWGGNFLALASLGVLLAWPRHAHELWRFLFGVLYLPGWSLSMLFKYFYIENPSPLEKSHEKCHLLSVAFLVGAVVSGWPVALFLGGILLIGSALFYLWAQQRVL